MNNALIFNPAKKNQNQNFSSENFKDYFGLKGVGLLKIKGYTPKFILISTEFYKEYLLSGFSDKLKYTIEEIIKLFGTKESLIIRSSGVKEEISERGMYSSKIIRDNLKSETLLNAINKIFEDFEYQKESPKEAIALIVQLYKVPKAKGHASNERRVSRNNNTWLFEVEQADSDIDHRVTNLRSKKTSTLEKLSMTVLKNRKIEDVIKVFLGRFIEDDRRFHFEWVLSESKIYIVQIDVEEKSLGDTPGSKWKYNYNRSEKKEFKVLKVVSDSDTNWKKLKSIKLFRKCNFKYGNIWILSDNKIFKKLVVENKFSDELLKDLKKLLENPIVIRTDCNSIKNNFLLPRTTTIKTIAECQEFIIKTLKGFIEQEIALDSICFLFHHYISSKACALTFSKPNVPRVRIDSSWGLPDGLHCFSHDTFEVNLSKEETIGRIKSKYEYLDCNTKGDWVKVNSGWNWDWKSSLTDDQLNEIANMSYEIANEVNQPVGVMFFVDIDKSTDYPEILPWYHTLEVPASTYEATKIIFPQKTFLITEPKDLENLKKMVLGNDIVVKLKLKANYIRNNEFIVNVGKYLSRNDIPVVLEGSILSHVFYILKRENVNVKCTIPFDSKNEKQLFNKLVRDQIPKKILSHGETATIMPLGGETLLKKLKSKAIEESLELFRETDINNTIEEMADIYQVISSICNVLGVDFKNVENIAKDKINAKGGFEEGIFLISTSEAPLIPSDTKDKVEIVTDKNYNSDELNLKKVYVKNKVEFNIPFVPPLGNLIKTNLEFNDFTKLSFEIEYQKDNILLRVIKENNLNDNPNQLKLNF